MNKRWISASVAVAMLLGSAATPALAFNDLKKFPEAEKIMELRDRGIINGVTKHTFAPHKQMTASQAIPLIVRTLGLEKDKSGQKVSDIFKHISEDDWYADAFLTAHVNGFTIDPNIRPNDPVTREQFVKWLMFGINAKGDYAFAMIYINLEDEDEVSEGYMNAIQNALVANIAELDEDNKFRPKDIITRAEAAVMAYNAAKFIDEVEPIPELLEGDPIENGEVTATLEPINDEVQKLTLDWGEKGHSGWGISIDRIDFPSHGKAIVHYTLHYPDPDGFYAMVITYPKDSVYLDASITDIEYVLTNPEDWISPAEPQPIQPPVDPNKSIKPIQPPVDRIIDPIKPDKTK